MRFKSARVAVLMGGRSAERRVSLQSGTGVFEALSSAGYDAVAVDWTESTHLADQLRAAGTEVVWNALHGTDGEDGAVQGLLQCLRIPYTGSGILASALAMDKLASKRALRAEELPTPDWFVLGRDQDVSAIPTDFELPLVVKPASEGSSVGVTIARTQQDLVRGIDIARGCQGATLVEQFVDGAEVNVGILGHEVLGSVEIRPATEFYDYEAKYERDDTQYLVPPDLDTALVKKIEAIAWLCHQAIGCRGYSRIDLMVAKGTGDIFFIEANTLPGMTSHSLLPKIAAKAGLSYSELCERILDLAAL